MIARTVHVIGLDLSLTNSGIAVLGCTPDDRWTAHTYGVPTAGCKTDTDDQLLDRMEYIASSVADAAGHTDAIVIERPAFSAHGSATATLAGVYWLCYRRLRRLDLPILVVSASSLKKYATGQGNAAKRDVSRATARMWPEVRTSTGDEDDALVLASIGAELMNLPIPYDRTQYRREALAGITRPERWTEQFG